MRHVTIQASIAALLSVSVGMPPAGSVPQNASPATSASTAPGDDAQWSRVQLRDVFARDAARRALAGAAGWLANPTCQALFSEFHNDRGVPLSEKLRELAPSPQSYLHMVFFLDGEQQPPCKRDGVLAFTTPGSRVVYLCGGSFERATRRNIREVQATIIHELLHSLGLGENPPSPRHITNRVQRLCWQ